MGKYYIDDPDDEAEKEYNRKAELKAKEDERERLRILKTNEYHGVIYQCPECKKLCGYLSVGFDKRARCEECLDASIPD